MKKHIAIVEDEPALRDNYAAALARHGYLVKTYGNRKSAMQAFTTHLPDLAIIDISLEDEAEGGFDLCRDLRALSAELPIIFLTARDSELDAVSGLRLGADDFLTKDVSLPHLAARVAALFRRIDALRRPDNAAEILRRGALSIDGEKMQTTWNGAPVTLSLTEFWIVHALARNPGHVKNRQQLMDAANVVLDDSTITSHVKRVRRKFLELSTPISTPSKRCMAWVIAGSSEHPPSTADRRAHHPRAAVGRLPICARARERRCVHRRKMPSRRAPTTIAQALSAEPARVFREEDSGPFAANQADLYVFPLHNQPLLDGYREDWNVSADPQPLPSAAGHPARLLAGITERYLFLYLEVDDPKFVAEPPDVHPEHDRFDRVDLTLQRPDGALESYFFATSAPGLIEAQSVIKGDDGVDRAASEPRIQAFWLQTASRLSPGSAPAVEHGGFAPLDRSAGRERRRVRFLGADSMRGGRLFMATPGLNELLDIFISAGHARDRGRCECPEARRGGCARLERGRRSGRDQRHVVSALPHRGELPVAAQGLVARPAHGKERRRRARRIHGGGVAAQRQRPRCAAVGGRSDHGRGPGSRRRGARAGGR